VLTDVDPSEERLAKNFRIPFRGLTRARVRVESHMEFLVRTGKRMQLHLTSSALRGIKDYISFLRAFYPRKLSWVAVSGHKPDSCGDPGGAGCFEYAEGIPFASTKRQTTAGEHSRFSRFRRGIPGRPPF
jgi:hypothetical protein